MVELAEAPAAPDTFGGLLRAGETPEEALRRLEKTKAYAKTIGSDDGQRLLAAAHVLTRGRKPAILGSLADVAPKLVERLTASPVVEVLEISVADLVIGPNVRVDPGELDELAANIQQHGVLQPIRVRPEGAGWVVLVGQRRTLAAKRIGLERIPAVIDRAAKTSAVLSIEQLSENLVRKDMNPIEEAVALRAVLDATAGLTQDALATQLGRSGPWVSNTLRLLDTAPEVQELVRTAKLTTAHAKAIAGLDVDLQADFADRVAKSHWSSADTERNVKWEKETAARTREQRVAGAKHAAAAIAILEKVANRAKATIYVETYAAGATVKKLLAADGWKAEPSSYGIDTVKNAGSCGCAGVWKVNVPYGAGSLTVSPACHSKEHKAARDAEREAEWARERAKNERERKARLELERRTSLRLGEILAAEPLAPTTLRLAIYAFATGETDEAVADLLGIDDDDEVLDNVAQDIDVTWSALEAMQDDQLASTFAKAIALSLDDQWRIGQGAKDAIAALLAAHPEPAVAAAKPTKGKKAAPAS